MITGMRISHGRRAALINPVVSASMMPGRVGVCALTTLFYHKSAYLGKNDTTAQARIERQFYPGMKNH
jgi:hypothetical protein